MTTMGMFNAWVNRVNPQRVQATEARKQTKLLQQMASQPADPDMMQISYKDFMVRLARTEDEAYRRGHRDGWEQRNQEIKLEQAATPAQREGN